MFVNKDGKPIGNKVSCYACGGNHYKGDPACPKLNTDENYSHISNQLSVAFISTQPRSIIDKDWILLDNQSTVHIFKSSSMVSNITRVPPSEGLIIHSNGGSQYTNQIAFHPDVGRVWFHPQAITNILSFSKYQRAGMPLHYDHDNDHFTLTTPNGRTFYFKHMANDLYACDLTSQDAVCLTTTVTELQRAFTPHQIADADKARSLHHMLGRPSERIFKHMIKHNLIRNTTVTCDDITRASKIYGPDLGCLKGKTTRQAPTPVRLPSILPVPDSIKMHHLDVVICLNICHVDGLRFLTSIS